MRYGLSDGIEKSRDAIAKELGLSWQRVDKLETRSASSASSAKAVWTLCAKRPEQVSKRKAWVLDTGTKGTGAEMVPLEKVLKKPAPDKGAGLRSPEAPPTNRRGA